MDRNNMKELQRRKMVCQLAIESLLKEENDPRVPLRLSEYRAQLSHIDEAIEDLNKRLQEDPNLLVVEDEKPHDIVIGLKPGVMFPKVPRS